jgi:hypothetical protein
MSMQHTFPTQCQLDKRCILYWITTITELFLNFRNSRLFALGVELYVLPPVIRSTLVTLIKAEPLIANCVTTYMTKLHHMVRNKRQDFLRDQARALMKKGKKVDNTWATLIIKMLLVDYRYKLHVINECAPSFDDDVAINEFFGRWTDKVEAACKRKKLDYDACLDAVCEEELHVRQRERDRARNESD